MIINTSNHDSSIDNRLIAFVDDVCKSRNYHVVETKGEFLVFPEHTKRDEERDKHWTVSKTFECNCTQSEYAAECIHVEVVQAAITGEYEPTERTRAISEGRSEHGLTWVKMTDQEVDLNKNRSEEQIVAVNQIGDRLILFESGERYRIRYENESATNGTDCVFPNLSTDCTVLTSFTDSSETKKRQDIISHIEDVLIRDRL